MAIVKNSQSDRLLRDAVVLDLGDLQRQAVAIIDEANRQAQAILARAREEAGKLVDEASDKGFAQGLSRGLVEGRETGRQEARQESLAEHQEMFATLEEKWNVALQRWDEDRQDMLRSARDDVLRFAFALARKIVHRHVEHHPESVVDQVEHALAVLSRPTSLVIHLHPEDAPIIEEVLPRLSRAVVAARHATLHEDASIGRGGCLIRMEGGQIDASIQMQLDRMARTLLPDASGEEGVS